MREEYGMEISTAFCEELRLAAEMIDDEELISMENDEIWVCEGVLGDSFILHRWGDLAYLYQRGDLSQIWDEIVAEIMEHDEVCWKEREKEEEDEREKEEEDFKKYKDFVHYLRSYRGMYKEDEQE